MTAAFFYTLSAYRLINLYTRSAVGEVLATVFLPLLMLGMYQLFYGNYKKWLTAVLAFTALFQSHMISTELALGFAVLFALLLPAPSERPEAAASYRTRGRRHGASEPVVNSALPRFDAVSAGIA